MNETKHWHTDHRSPIISDNPLEMASAAIQILLAKGARPLAFAPSAASAERIADLNGLPYIAPHLPTEVREDIITNESLAGLICYQMYTGWTAPWATDVVLIASKRTHEADIAQAIARADRIGRTADLNVWYIVDTDTVR